MTRWKKISFLIPLFSIIAVLALLIIDVEGSYEPVFLLPLLNTVFLGIFPIEIAVISFLIFKKTSLVNILLFGCGMLVFALGSTVAGWVRDLPDGANMTVTIHNSSAFVASIFHFLGAYKDEYTKPVDERKNALRLGGVIFGILLFILLISVLTYSKFMPKFYENGPTFLRQCILGSSIALFFSSSILLLKMYQKQKFKYYFWYSSTLILYTIGLLSVSAEDAVGSVIGWIGRFDQYLGGVYGIFALISIYNAGLFNKQQSNFNTEFFLDAEKSYKELVESSYDAIITVDRDLRIRFINKAAILLFEFGTENPVGMQFSELIHNYKNLANLSNNMELPLEPNRISELEAISRKGRMFPVSVSATKRNLQSGVAFTYIIRDITPAKQAEKQSELLAQSLRGQIEFEKMVKSLAKDFINIPIEKVNHAIDEGLNFIGEYCQADLIAIYLYDWKNETVSLENEWVRDERFRIKDDTYREFPISWMPLEILDSHINGLPYFITNESSEIMCFLNKTGIQATTSIPLMVNGKAIGSCNLGNSNSTKWSQSTLAIMTLFCEMLSNVFQRIQNENRLLENNQVMTLLLNSSNDGIGMLDKEGTILSINSRLASRFGKDPDAITGINLKELIPKIKYGDLFEQRLLIISKVFDTMQPEQFEDGRDGFWFLNSIYPVFKEGKVIAVTLFSTDITDRKRALEEARKNAEYETRLKVQTDFFTNISHEFKTPLTIILLQLQMMKSYTSDKAKVETSIESLIQNAYRLARLVGNLIDINKIDAGYLKVEMHYIDIVPLIREIADSVKSYALSKSITVQFETKLLGYYMAADSDKIERIILNLLSNAIKFTPEGGAIKITARGKAESLLITVSDTGIGIPKDKIELIFDRFSQVDTSFTRNNEGSGIGLSLTKSLVELLKGKIRVESKLGKGSKFFVELPVLQIEENQQLFHAEADGLLQKVKMEFSDIY